MVFDLALGNVLKTYSRYPLGALFRVLPHGAAQLSLDEIVALNKRIYGEFDLDYPHPGPDDGHPAGIHDKYAATAKVCQTTVVEGVTQAGTHYPLRSTTRSQSVKSKRTAGQKVWDTIDIIPDRLKAITAVIVALTALATAIIGFRTLFKKTPPQE